MHAHVEGGLEIADPNNDGKLRLDEIGQITHDFTELEHLFCMLDFQGTATFRVGGSVTAGGVTLVNGQIGLDTGSFKRRDAICVGVLEVIGSRGI